MNQKILITGKNGDLGEELNKKFKRNKIVTFKRIGKSKSQQLENLQKIFKKNNIETVFHCATIFKGTKKKIDECNLVFSNFLFKLCKENNTKFFFNFDTILPQNINHYTKSKYKFLNNIKKEKSICIINLKISHIYSFNKNKKKFIPFVINKIKNNEPCNLTNGNQKRYFINSNKFINQVYKIYLIRKKIKENFQQFTFISKNETSIKDLVIILRNIINKNYNKLNFGALKYRKNELMKINLKKIKGKKIILNSNLKNDLSKICQKYS